MGLNREACFELAFTENPQPQIEAANDARVFQQRAGDGFLRVDFAVRDGLLETPDIDNRIALLKADIRKAALGQAHMDGRLAALEAADGRAGA